MNNSIDVVLVENTCKTLTEELQEFFFEPITSVTEAKLRNYISNIEANINAKNSSTQEEISCLKAAYKLLVENFDNFSLNYRKGLINNPKTEIDNYIDKWHNNVNLELVSLHEYLGFTWYEYSQWISNPSILLLILNAK